MGISDRGRGRRESFCARVQPDPVSRGGGSPHPTDRAGTGRDTAIAPRVARSPSVRHPGLHHPVGSFLDVGEHGVGNRASLYATVLDREGAALPGLVAVPEAKERVGVPRRHRVADGVSHRGGSGVVAEGGNPLIPATPFSAFSSGSSLLRPWGRPRRTRRPRRERPVGLPGERSLGPFFPRGVSGRLRSCVLALLPPASPIVANGRPATSWRIPGKIGTGVAMA